MNLNNMGMGKALLQQVAASNPKYLKKWSRVQQENANTVSKNTNKKTQDE